MQALKSCSLLKYLQAGITLNEMVISVVARIGVDIKGGRPWLPLVHEGMQLNGHKPLGEAINPCVCGCVISAR